MGAELASLLEVYHLMQKAGRSATLTLSSKGGKATIAKLVIELDDAVSTATTSLPSMPAVPAPGSRRHRRRSKAAKAKANARAAKYQATQAKCAASPASGEATSASLDRPLLPFPPPPQNPTPARRLVTVIRRRANTWTSFNQLDGATEETPPSPLQPPSHSPTASPTEKVRWLQPKCLDSCEPGEHCDLCGLCHLLCEVHAGCICEEQLEEEGPILKPDAYLTICEMCIRTNKELT